MRDTCSVVPLFPKPRGAAEPGLLGGARLWLGAEHSHVVAGHPARANLFLGAT